MLGMEHEGRGMQAIVDEHPDDEADTGRRAEVARSSTRSRDRRPLLHPSARRSTILASVGGISCEEGASDTFDGGRTRLRAAHGRCQRATPGRRRQHTGSPTERATHGLKNRADQRPSWAEVALTLAHASIPQCPLEPGIGASEHWVSAAALRDGARGGHACIRESLWERRSPARKQRVEELAKGAKIRELRSAGLDIAVYGSRPPHGAPAVASEEHDRAFGSSPANREANRLRGSRTSWRVRKPAASTPTSIHATLVARSPGRAKSIPA